MGEPVKNPFITPLLENILKLILDKQHEVIDGALRDEVVSVSHIKKVFDDLGIKEKPLEF